jgi:hypothetical protein
MSSTTVRAFAEVMFSDVLAGQRQKMLQEIQDEPTNKLLNVNESEYVHYLVDKFRVEAVTLDFEALQVSHAEKMIPAEAHPFDFGCHYGHSQKTAYPRQVITFHIPFTGDPGLLKCQPSTYLGGAGGELEVSGKEIRFSLINWRNDAQQLKTEQTAISDRLRKQCAYLAADVQQFNTSLDGQARSAISACRAHLLGQLNLVQSLGIPLRKAPSVPPTFAVPIVPKKVLVKPSAPEAAYLPQPTLDQATYNDILSIIHENGKAMERHPSTYTNKEEEDLRDFLLMTLSTHYPNTTGETFNKKGKTDILVRHEGTNVFVGECKFWKGLKGFHDTIDQILGYLTWRDSKAAVVCFVNNKEFSPVIEQIATGTAQHACFIRLVEKMSENWFRFEFRLKTDPTRNVHLAVLCFHFPPS